MNKTQFSRMAKKAVRSVRLNEAEDYDSIMDEAATSCDTDAEWDRFVEAVDEGVKVPLTPREQKMADNRKRRQEIHSAFLALKAAQLNYDKLTRNSVR